MPLRTIDLLHFQVSVAKKQADPWSFLFYDSQPSESPEVLVICSPPSPPKKHSYCFALSCGGSWFWVQAIGNAIFWPHTSVSQCLMSVARALLAVTGAHCYFGSMCLSNWSSGFLVLWCDSTCFGLQNSHDVWWPPTPVYSPLTTHFNKEGMHKW